MTIQAETLLRGEGVVSVYPGESRCNPSARLLPVQHGPRCTPPAPSVLPPSRPSFGGAAAKLCRSLEAPPVPIVYQS